jgi:hypothetical protein
MTRALGIQAFVCCRLVRVYWQSLLAFFVWSGCALATVESDGDSGADVADIQTAADMRMPCNPGQAQTSTLIDRFLVPSYPL